MIRTEDVMLILLALQLLSYEVDDNISDVESDLKAHINEQRRLNRSLPDDKVRVTWESFCSRLSESHFRRMFRMTQNMFKGLCNRIIDCIGSDVFRSEQYLREKTGGEERIGKSPLISGEVKCALSIRMLAGGSYLDLVPLFNVSSGHLYVVLETFLAWILATFEFPLTRLLRDQNWSALQELAAEFAAKTDGVFYGPFGALDGLAVRIRSPSLKEVSDPGNYYCRKGFYALNVQAICDMKKRFLWCLTSNKGSTHDSTAFANSRLYGLLQELASDLYEKGLFIVGDSAYGLTPFLLVPYDQNEIKRHGGDVDGSLDSFNFHLSSCRINIECAFGELVMRWGILWRTLLFNLKKAQDIVMVCMLLQNYIIDNRDGDGSEKDSHYFLSFNIDIDETQARLYAETGEMPRAVVTDNNEPARRGRRTVLEEGLSEVGNNVRRRMSVELAAREMRRPLQKDMQYNSYGHIYFS